MSRFPRLTQIRQGKYPVYLGAGLALVGVGAAIAVSGTNGPAANAGTAAIARAASAANPGTTGNARQEGQPTRAERQATGTDKSKPWGVVIRSIAANTNPKLPNGQIGPADRLHPAGFSGPQATLPITADRLNNATTIVREALAKKMGLRAAVIAVATSMQESTLLNLHYGDRDSLGLFQQRPSCGWGTPQQILTPTYAADAFLNALRTYQSGAPGWATQPLWVPAQGVQQSGFPYAYAKWEAQAASLVGQIATKLS